MFFRKGLSRRCSVVGTTHSSNSTGREFELRARQHASTDICHIKQSFSLLQAEITDVRNANWTHCLMRAGLL